MAISDKIEHLAYLSKDHAEFAKPGKYFVPYPTLALKVDSLIQGTQQKALQILANKDQYIKAYSNSKEFHQLLESKGSILENLSKDDIFDAALGSELHKFGGTIQAKSLQVWGLPNANRIIKNSPNPFLEIRKLIDALYFEYTVNRSSSAIGMFSAYGSRTIRVSPALAIQFEDTEVSGWSAKDLILPLNTFYLQFPKELNLSLLNGKLLIDGAMISQMTSLKTLIMTIFGYCSAVGELQSVTIPLKMAAYESDLSDCVDQALSIEIADMLERQSAFNSTDINNVFLEIVGKGSLEEKDLMRAFYLKENTRLNQLIQEKDQIKKVVNLISNSLLYMTGYPDDIEKGYDDVAPEKLVRQAISGTEREKRRAQSQLSSLNFSEYFFIGKKAEAVIGAQNTEGQVASHWRRGSWISQPYGKERAFRRPQWRKGSLVNSEKVNELKAKNQKI